MNTYIKYQEGVAKLKKRFGNEETLTVLRWLLESITGKKQLFLTADKVNLSEVELETLQQMVHKLVDQEYPVQYLLGTVPFGPLEIVVEPPLLIPRPETEQWVADLIEQLQPFANQQLTILDLCCGSGCIGLWLAKAFPHFKIIAADINPQAVKITAQNADKNNIKNLIAIESDLFSNIKNYSFDLVVSNPPYISEKEFTELEPVVTKWEDKNALVAQHDGFYFYEQIAKITPQFLKQESPLKGKAPQLVVEIGHQQGNAVVLLFETVGFKKVVVNQDLAGKDRVVSCY